MSIGLETVLPIMIGVINFAALCVVAWQTYLTRRAVQLTQTTMGDKRLELELSSLPDIDILLEVKVYLERWKDDLRSIVEDRQLIIDRIDLHDSTIGSEYGFESPKGLINRAMYDHCLPWLQRVLEAAAQYYFNAKSTAFYLDPERGRDFALGMLESAIERADVGNMRISEMLTYIDSRTPSWYLESPASLNVSHFFDR